MFGGLSRIAFKLGILAGIPVIGALLLALQIESGARDRVRAAESIGSVEDLAELSARMTATLGELQTERALAALSLGLRAAPEPNSSSAESATAALVAQEKQTDAAIRRMESFLSERDLSRLPLRLGGDLARARLAIDQAANVRREILAGNAAISESLDYYGKINATLIDATAALTNLSDDGELLRALSSLVAMMQVQECESREHAVLSHAFAKGEFAPGLFRLLVTLVTEQAVQVASLESFASLDQVQAYRRAVQSPVAVRAQAMRNKALEAADDDLGIDARDWFDAQRSAVHQLSTLERGHAERVRRIAARKLEDTRRAVRYSEALAASVVLVSALLAVLIGRGITRTVLSLVSVAGRVQREQDFSLRAVKTSADELGALTDAFNEMLSGIQERDQALSSHRENLEQLVKTRTSALSKRNEDMRLVLDTVEQGLVTLDRDGRIAPERSRAFDTFFGRPDASVHYYTHIAGSDRALAERLELDWSQLVSNVLPIEVALDQAKASIERDGREFALGYKPILDGEEVNGALLTVSDVTREVKAQRAEAAQREQVRAFTRIMKDKSGFLQFFDEARQLMEHIRASGPNPSADTLRAVHTLKGNAALFDIASVAEAAHAFEQALADGGDASDDRALRELIHAWESFSERIAEILQDSAQVHAGVTQVELEQLFQLAQQGHGDELLRLVRHLAQEPIEIPLQRIAEQLRFVARRLGRSEPQISISAQPLRMPRERYHTLWSAFAHVVRNVADHGLESEEERALAGKPTQNRVQLRAALRGSQLVLQVEDDGRGIDWTRVAERARAQDLPHATQSDLVEAVFAPGVSTSEVVSETSGRGVGMSAVREVCRALGGDATIESTTGQGTKLTLSLRWP